MLTHANEPFLEPEQGKSFAPHLKVTPDDEFGSDSRENRLCIQNGEIVGSHRQLLQP